LQEGYEYVQPHEYRRSRQISQTQEDHGHLFAGVLVV
jgi:hypothetical protein